MAINLLKEGIEDFVILEKGAGFGGTWKDNAYPGCCCDSKLLFPSKHKTGQGKRTKILTQGFLFSSANSPIAPLLLFL